MAEPAGTPIPVDIGWHMDSEQAALAFLPPEPLDAASRERLGPAPGAGELAARIVQIRCPYTVRVRVTPRGVRPVTFFRVEEPGALSERVQGPLHLSRGQAQRSAGRCRCCRSRSTV